jgi:hypothetical protein
MLNQPSVTLKPELMNKLTVAYRPFLIVIIVVLLSGCKVTNEGKAIVPRKTVSLFNGKDLSAFYTWLPEFGHADPDKVFTVVDDADGRPAIRISGQHYGGLITKDEYADYKLVAEFRWGLETWEPRKARARDAGILLHGQGEDGNAKNDFKSPWFRSVEYQIIEGGTGDIILVNGFDRGSDQAIAPSLTVSVLPGTRVWNPEGTPAEFRKGRIDWRYRDHGWRDVINFRGAKDVERRVGEWNLIEVICRGGDVTYFLNGAKVNEGSNGSFTKGKLLIQSEGAEIFFRRIELQPINR